MRSATVLLLLVLASFSVSCGKRSKATSGSSGEVIYAEQCASCHGAKGEGVDEEYDEPLWGNKSPESLARYIHKSMPEDDEEAVVDEDAEAVAQYVYDAFYSPAAQARNSPPRVELLRLTNNQYRQSMTDLIGSLGPQTRIGTERGLKGRYHNSEKMAKEKDFIGERVDRLLDFDFGKGVPMENMTQQGFSIRWTGSLIAPESGEYDIRLRTHNGALLQLNSFGGGGDEDAFIDAYVSTNNELQEKSRKIFLLGGRAYPLHLQYFSYQEKVSSIHLEWKLPHGVWEAIPHEFLSPQGAAPVTLVQANFSADDRSRGFERGSAISKEWQEATTFAAVEIVNHVVANLEQLGRQRKKNYKEAGDLRKLCMEIAERAFRRPLDGEQKAFFIDSRFEGAKDVESAAKQSLLLILTSPRFLYPGLADNEGAPDGDTIASRLALTLWDSLPDEELCKAAREGTLQSTGQVAAQARRLLEDPRARIKTREFFQEWLAMDEREDLGKDGTLYPGFDQRIVADLRGSLETFVEEVVWSERSDYRELLTADYLYLNPRLAEFYGGPVPDGEPYAKVAAPDGMRSGIFTHPYLLAANAYHDNTSPIHRGVFLSRNVLGRLLKPPPEAVAFKNEEFDPTLTMREKVTELTKKDTCMQCHRVINPIGFSLESYDAVGRYRTTDNKKPINTVSDYVNDQDEQIRVESARDLAKLAVESEAAHRAFITHLFHHLTKQSTEAYGGEALDLLRGTFVDSGYNMQNLIVEIATVAALHHEEDEAVALSTPTP